MAKYKNNLSALLDVCKALADETRFRAWAVLQRQELCACQLIELLELAPSTVSRHLSVLKQAGLIDSRKQGRWVYYFSLTDAAEPARQSLINEMLSGMARDPQLSQDRKRLKEILAIDPEELCRTQCA